MTERKQEKGIEIELDEKSAEGVFSNLALINHSSTEFVMDFIQVMPGMPKGKVKSRIILTPQHMKRLAGALIDNIHKYEKEFGEIIDQEKGVTQNLFHFGDIQGEA